MSLRRVGRKMVAKKRNRRAYRKPAQVSIWLSSPAATSALGRSLGLVSDPPRAWLLRGPLGAGKTTLVRGLLRGLGVSRGVVSPTFTLAKIYRLRRRRWGAVIHLDGYRLRGRSELPALELQDWLDDPRTLVLVEWPERFPGVAWGRHGLVTLRHLRRGRQATIQLRGR